MSEPVIIKKYANRRLYNTETSTYITLEDLAVMVRDEREFEVVDAKTGNDITRSVLTQIIFEEENKGSAILPIGFLRSIIRFYDHSLQNIVPQYLDMTMEAFSKNQKSMQEQAEHAFNPFHNIEEMQRKNIEMVRKTAELFNPFFAAMHQNTDQEIEALNKQIAELQKRVDLLKSKA